jgi:Uncharacterized protein conserved in bacteria
MLNLDIKKVKIIFTVPLENAEEIRLLLGYLGAGIIGNYTHCSISTDCIGTFKGTDDSNPYIGNKNNLETVNEVKIEVQCEIEKIKKVLEELRKAHPYEEPAIDIVPLIDEKDLV